MADALNRDFYAVLGVAHDAPAEVVRAAGRVLLQKYHPDRNSEPDAGERTEEVSVAYRILTDPERRAQYDEQLRARRASHSQSEHLDRDSHAPDLQSDVSVRRTVGRTVYELRFQQGLVREHTEWSEVVEVTRSDQRLFIGKGTHVVTESRIKQRVWLRLGCEERLLEYAGSILPVATGQPVTLASIADLRSHKAATPLVLENRASGQHYLLTGYRDAAAGLLSTHDVLVQAARFAAVMFIGLGVLYFAFLRQAGFLAWGLSLVLGVPALFGAIRELTRREARRLEEDIRDALRARQRV